MRVQLGVQLKQWLIVAIVVWAAAFSAIGSVEHKWQAGEYCGLIIGKSTKDEVRKKFGKPVWSGKPEEKLIAAEHEGEIWYEYVNVGGLKGRTTIVVGARSEIVKAVILYPEKMMQTQAIRLYGSEYIERAGKLGPCPTPSEIREFKPPRQTEYPVFLVYAHLGTYVSINEDKTVLEIGYLLRCP